MSKLTWPLLGCIVSLSAAGGCSGGTTDSGPVSGPGPGPGEPNEPIEQGDEEENPFDIGPAPSAPGDCNGCSNLLDGDVNPEAPICEGAENLIAGIVQCACASCPDDCGGFCDDGGAIDETCATCIDAACPGAIDACEAN